MVTLRHDMTCACSSLFKEHKWALSPYTTHATCQTLPPRRERLALNHVPQSVRDLGAAERAAFDAHCACGMRASQFT